MPRPEDVRETEAGDGEGGENDATTPSKVLL